ncbi:hypothetical protein [Marinobacter confluentis]|uniref:Xanthine/uracil/vitamin C permease n=1 Tax=Marinobacter confluentis TaxID=1697557 RepID=A0A4Z1CB56_9GAMM|nr:hypothetical protein [Marinobacter confluentis]TGN41123.1 hypothetical protein E5Q11_00785 [Marinobacter confluentis]
MSERKELPGWRWGPFTFRLPFYHTKLCWSEFLQGLMVSAATGLALVPIMTAFFGFSFEEAIALSMIHAFLIASAVIVFGEPYAGGWITPALPLILAFVIGGYEDPSSRFQAMTALTLVFASLVFILGITGLGRKMVIWLPDTLKAGIILGASIAALKRVFIDDADKFLLEQPIATTMAVAVCLIFTFSIPMQKLKERNRFFLMLGALGLLPGFLVAAMIGPLVGEVNFDIEWGFMVPPLAEAFAKASPLVNGWPTIEMLAQSIPLALIAYIILFGDIVTGNEVLRDGMAVRKDEHIDINLNRTHYSLAIRNAAMAIVAPFFPTQGAVWTGVHVIVVQRWKQGPKAMGSLHSGLASYYLMGLPFIYFLLPLMTGLKPLLGIALSLTLVLTGFACAYIAMSIPKSNASRGTVVLIGAALAFFEPWIGLLIGVVATLTMVGWDRNADPIPHD